MRLCLSLSVELCLCLRIEQFPNLPPHGFMQWKLYALYCLCKIWNFLTCLTHFAVVLLYWMVPNFVGLYGVWLWAMASSFQLPSSTRVDERVSAILAARLTFNWPLLLKAFICNFMLTAQSLERAFKLWGPSMHELLSIMFSSCSRTTMIAFPPHCYLQLVITLPLPPSIQPQASGTCFGFLFMVALFFLY